MKNTIKYVDGTAVLNNFHHLIIKNGQVIMSYNRYGIRSFYEWNGQELKKVFPTLDELLVGYNHANPSQGRYYFFKRVPYSIGRRV